MMTSYFQCTTIFCDDLRHELNGKISLMGIYTGDMYVPEFPITLLKICAFFDLRIPARAQASTDAVLSVTKGSERINSITLPVASLSTDEESRHGKPYVFRQFTGGMEFPSITFTESTLLEVTAQYDGQSVVAGRLWITRFPEQNAAQVADIDH